MLQNIRDNIQGTAAKVVIALIIVPFALFGVESLFSSSSEKPAAVVNGEKVTERDLAQAIAMQKRRLLNVMGDNIEPAMLDDAILRRPALDSLVKQQLLLQAAAESTVTISNKQLDKLIASMPQFMDGERFSQQRYEQILRSQGYNSAFFKQLLRSDLTVQQLSSAVSATQFVTDSELAAAVALLYETRDYQYMTVPLAPLQEGLSVSDEDIQQWYESNSENYLSDEQVRFSYIEVTEEQFLSPVSEGDIEREYQSAIAANNASTEREAAHILLERRDGESQEELQRRIDEVGQRLAAGEDFASLAKELSDDIGSAGDGGALGFTTGDSFPPEFESVLAMLEPDAVSAAVTTEAGTHYIKLLSVREPEIPSLDDMRDEIRERLERQAAQPQMIAVVDDLRDLVFNAENLDMPARELSLEVKQSGLLSRSDSTGLFAYADLKQAAFDREIREQKLNSKVLELAPDRYLVLHVEEYLPAQVLPLEKVRDDVVAHIRREEAQRLAAEKAEGISNALRAGSTIESVAKDEGLQWQAVLDSRRSSLDVDAEILRQAFAAPHPTTQSSVTSFQQSSGDWVVIAVSEVSAGNLSSIDAATRVEARKTLAERSASQSFSAYFNSLWKNAEVKIN